jgi:hypothetical protein
MHKTLLTILIGISVLVACSARAASWESCTSGNPMTRVDPKGSICVDFTTSDLTTDILAVSQCENFDVLYSPDIGGTDTSTSVIVYNCLSTTLNTNNCKAIGGITLSGTSPSTEIYGAAGAWIYAVATGAGAGDEPRLLIHCNP